MGGKPAPVPVYLAALAPASVRLTGEIADGWMPFFFPLSRLHEGVALLQEGSAKGSAPGHPCRICPAVGVAVAEDERVARETAAWWVAFYLTSMGPLYARTLERFGYGSEVAAVLSANPSRSTPVVPPEAESLIDELVVFGTPSRARGRLTRWYTEGAELLVVSFPPNRPWEETEFALAGLVPARIGELRDVRDISRIAYGFIASQALFAALELDLFSLLADGRKPLKQLADDTKRPRRSNGDSPVRAHQPRPCGLGRQPVQECAGQ